MVPYVVDAVVAVTVMHVLLFLLHVVVRLSVHVHFNMGLSPRDS